MTLRTIDLRSDTVTLPTDEMYDAMRSARLGDDNWRDDPTVLELEAAAAEAVGHEAALFCPSGTMANLLGTRLYTKPGDGVVLPEKLNMSYGLIAWNGLQPFALASETGFPAIDDLAHTLEWAVDSETPAMLVVVEMPHNMIGGTVISPDYLAAVRDTAHRYGLPFYLDGARVFNAAVALGRPASEFGSQADAMMFCLSKGLSAPVGSMLCGRREFIERATKLRYRMGGAMRQAGLLAACGLYALRHLVDRLAEDHANARLLAQAAGRWPWARLGQPSVDTNMVFLDVRPSGLTPEQVVSQLAEGGVLAAAVDPARVRLVTHRGITASDIEQVIDVLDGLPGIATPAVSAPHSPRSK
jgi:threonine aldolase